MEKVVNIPILTSFVFESDVESHITAGELSDLSDILDNSDTDPIETSLTAASATMSLDEIPYDRDLKRINVPVNSRPKGLVNYPAATRMLKCVEAITARSLEERTPSEKKKAPAVRVAQRRRDPGGNTPPPGAFPPPPAEIDRGRQGASSGKSTRDHGPPPQKSATRSETSDSQRKDKRGSRSAKSAREGAGRSAASVPDANTSMVSPLPPPPSPSLMSAHPAQLNPCAQEFVPSFLSR